MNNMEDSEDGLLTMGRICLQRGRNKEAFEKFDQTLAINPQSAIAWAGKGIALVNMKRHEEALNCFDKSILIDPKVAFAWEGKGMANRNAARLVEYLIKEFEKLDPDKFGFVSQGRLRKAGWQFSGDELTGEPK